MLACCLNMKGFAAIAKIECKDHTFGCSTECWRQGCYHTSSAIQYLGCRTQEMHNINTLCCCYTLRLLRTSPSPVSPSPRVTGSIFAQYLKAP